MGKNTPDRQLFILDNLVVEDPNIDKKEVLTEADTTDK
jgi:topoisomerase-4 subunit B